RDKTCNITRMVIPDYPGAFVIPCWFEMASCSLAIPSKVDIITTIAFGWVDNDLDPSTGTREPPIVNIRATERLILIAGFTLNNGHIPSYLVCLCQRLVCGVVWFLLIDGYAPAHSHEDKHPNKGQCTSHKNSANRAL